MKKNIKALIISAIIVSCSGSGERTAEFQGMEFDSIVVDSILSLAKDADTPKCHVRLSLQYVKGKNADIINQGVLHSGILTPDYFLPGYNTPSVSIVVDSFVKRFLYDYQKEYGQLYKADKEHAESYNCQYFVNTCTQNGKDNVMNYIATVYSFGGGAHGIRQTIARNFSVADGKLLTLDDILKPGYKSKLTDIIIHKMEERFDVESLPLLQEKNIFSDGKAYVPENYIIGKKSLTFIYCEDEIAPHEVGEIRVDIDYDDIDMK